jgi:ADP-ribosyl-[dinitrogen reductase] hydrolase
MNPSSRFRGCLLGLAAGDAVGTTVEFSPRGSFPPLTDMVGGGPFHRAAGQWTDDTSMALCLASSLVETGGFDAADQMARYVRWWKAGEWSPTGRCFDIGNATRKALQYFLDTGDPWAGARAPNAKGNGCIMRLAPVPMFYFGSREEAVARSAESARTTHGAPVGEDACRLLADVVWLALDGRPKEEVLLGHPPSLVADPEIRVLADGAYRDKSEDAIEGRGHVAWSLEAALWCFWVTDSFEAAILRAANLGDDADTTAAVCGQVAGAFYGVQGIPDPWLAKLAMRTEIEALADRLRNPLRTHPD